MQTKSHVAIETVSEGNKVLGFIEAIRQRALELFKTRGEAEGFAVDDWLQAERELFHVPESRYTENEKAFEFEFEAPDFNEKDLRVTALQSGVVVTGEMEKEGLSKSIFRRFDLPGPIEVTAMTAKLENGVLKVSAPKKAQAAPLAAAA